MTLAAGTRLGPYEILSAIGAGGMGEVYRARDTKLGRDVAIKVVSDGFSHDPERLARFQREAHLLASLNHPHIAAIYGLEEANGSQFLVLELVEGETLATRLKAGSIPVSEALTIARQITDALQAAHEKGIIHRDLKPANIAFTSDGQVKVLDFGLAKHEAGGAGKAGGAGDDFSQSPTMTLGATQAGVILGTAAYMAPEQAKGPAADKRSDVWAFGCVLYEMLTGKRAFEGEDVSDTLAAVLRGEPNWSAFPKDVPAHITTLVKRCLEKDRKTRIADISVAQFLMDDVVMGPLRGAVAPADSRRNRRRTLATSAGVAAALAVSALAGWMLRPAPREPRHVTRFPIELPAGSVIGNPTGHVIGLSPDGFRLLHITNQQIYMRSMDQNDPEPIDGTDLAPVEPVVSPDGQWIAFWARNQFWKIAVSGGAPIALGNAAGPSGVSWSGDTILFGAGSNGIHKLAAGGGVTEQLIAVDTKAGEQAHGPQLLPDGDSVLFTIRIGNRWDDGTMVIQSLKTGQRRVLVRGGTDARYLDTGHIVYGREGVLFAVAFDARRLEVTGNPVSVVEGVSQPSPAQGGATGALQFAVSATGTLVYVTGSSITERTLVWLDRQGREEPIPVPPRDYYYPRLSPDGMRIAVDVHDQEKDIWIWDLERRNLARLTSGRGEEFYPIWTRDGRRVIYSSANGPTSSLFWRLSDGTGVEERLTKEESNSRQGAEAISPDDKFIAVLGAGGGEQVLSLDDHSTRPLVQQPDGGGNQLAFSPDGRWIAYRSGVSGRPEIYVRPFPATGEGKWLVSTEGGQWPLWNPNGRELFYRTQQRPYRLMSVAVDTTKTFTAGTPVPLFDMTQYLSSNPGRSYDSRDGQRFLAVKNLRATETPRLQVVENWFDELRRIVPTK